MRPAPLYEHVRTFAEKKKISFHMPGHKNGRAFSDQNARELFRLDVTELSGLDNLQMPEEMIAEAEKLAAEAFGAGRTHFLVNGSTCGILAMIYAVLQDGDRVIVDRGCHESVINALVLRKAKAIFVAPEINHTFGLPAGVRVNTVSKAFARYQNIKAVIITSPNYYGMVSDIKKIAELSHEKGALLLVDEAHGAAFSFSEQLPFSALFCGADIAVQSMHKTLPAPNQTALLHVREGMEDDGAIKRAINMFQTTSPSYLLLAHMDLCRAIMEDAREELNSVIDFVREQKRVSPLKILETDDPLRLVVHTRSQGVTGYDASRQLARFGIYIEAADVHNVVCIINQYNTKKEIRELLSALGAFGAPKETCGAVIPAIKDIQKIDFEREYDGKWTAIEEAEGLTCAGNITVYPPCVPVIVQGEEITKEKIEYIGQIIRFGGEVKNMKNGMVLAEEER